MLCTANQCRSPMAEVLFDRRLRAIGVPATVRSAGELPGGVEASGGSVRAMARRGLDLSGHRSRTVEREMLERADLIVAMSRRHLRNAVVLHPPCFGRAFTLKELVRRAGDIGPRQPSESLTDWVARLHEGREHRMLLGDDERDDVRDPIGSPDEEYEATAVELERLVDQAVELAFAAADRRETA